MALLMFMMFAIYAIMVAAFAGAAACLIFAVYYGILAIMAQDEQTRKQFIITFASLLFGELLSFGLARFYAKYLKYINYLIIKNSWIWWIQKIIKIWAYPNPAPIVYIQPRKL